MVAELQTKMGAPLYELVSHHSHLRSHNTTHQASESLHTNTTSPEQLSEFDLRCNPTTQASISFRSDFNVPWSNARRIQVWR